MTTGQELIGLQNELAFNLTLQEEAQKVIAEQEQILYNLELEQVELEKDILSLLVLNEAMHEENTQAKKESYNILLNDIANDMLQGINVELDKNEQGETIQ